MKFFHLLILNIKWWKAPAILQRTSSRFLCIWSSLTQAPYKTKYFVFQFFSNDFVSTPLHHYHLVVINLPPFTVLSHLRIIRLPNFLWQVPSTWKVVVLSICNTFSVNVQLYRMSKRNYPSGTSQKQIHIWYLRPVLTSWTTNFFHLAPFWTTKDHMDLFSRNSRRVIFLHTGREVGRMETVE